VQTCGRAGRQVSPDPDTRGTIILSTSILGLSPVNFFFNLQSASADWFADILRHTYDDALCVKGIQGGVDAVFICAGMLRGDSVYGPGMKHLFGFRVGRQNRLRRCPDR
jgi:hypothetical protein